MKKTILSRQTQHPSKLGGFSLVELLVATTVSMLLIGILLGVTNGISTNYSRMQTKILNEGDASLVLDQIVQDIDGMVIPTIQGAESLRVTKETVEDFDNAIWLTLLTTATDKDDSDKEGSNNFNGATRAVSYQFAFQNVIDGGSEDPSYAIYRSIASARHTFENAVGDVNLQEDYWGELGEGGPLPPTDKDALLAENVVDITIRFFYLDEDGNEKWTEPGDNVRIGRDGTTVNDEPLASTSGFSRAQVSVTVVPPAGMELLKNKVLERPEVIKRFGRTFVRETSNIGGN